MLCHYESYAKATKNNSPSPGWIQKFDSIEIHHPTLAYYIMLPKFTHKIDVTSSLINTKSVVWTSQEVLAPSDNPYVKKLFDVHKNMLKTEI